MNNIKCSYVMHSLVKRMREWEFVEYLANHSELKWKEGTLNGRPGIFVKNNMLNTVTQFTDQWKIKPEDLESFIKDRVICKMIYRRL